VHSVREAHQSVDGRRARRVLRDRRLLAHGRQLEGPWGRKYPTVAQSWRRQWEQVIPFLAFAPEIRKIIYTTNAIESLHSQVRKSVRTRGHFPSDQAATKLIWLVLRNIEAKWKRPPAFWANARHQFAILFGDRFKITD
jgi:putative transposase